MPGAPWHHCVRIAPPSVSRRPPRVGGQFAWSPARTAVADERRRRPGRQLVRREELRAARERGDTPAKPCAGPRISCVEP